MDKSRVSLYKEYRDSIRKEGSIDPNEDYLETHHNLTSSIPLDEIINTIEENEEKIAINKARKKRKIIIYCGFFLIGALIIALTIIGIRLWR